MIKILKASCHTKSNFPTIYSLCSGKGRCGVSIIRVSGPNTKNVLKLILSNSNDLKNRFAHLRSFFHPKSRDLIDRGIVLWFPGTNSFTGEDSCEFHVHGSPAVVSAMLQALSDINGVFPSKAGEFTKRAFFNGKLDLTEVEGLADLIHAETETQRKQALLQSTGALSKLYNNWRARLIKCVAHLEAYIDFAEDENIEDDIIQQLIVELKNVKQDMDNHLNDSRKGEILRNGIRTVIVGAPNVGKSSFLNFMCKKNLSIVSSHPGTTRDIIETVQNFNGFPVIFRDTAGLRSFTEDPIEREGMARAKTSLEDADIILIVIDASKIDLSYLTEPDSLKNFIQQYIDSLEINEDILKNTKVRIILNKIDLISENHLTLAENTSNVWLISCKTGKNIENFLKNFNNLLVEMCGLPSLENPRITNSRHRIQLELCKNSINDFLSKYNTFENDIDMAIAAQNLRNSIKYIDSITGNVSSEEILDVIFKDFCIGK